MHNKNVEVNIKIRVFILQLFDGNKKWIDYLCTFLDAGFSEKQILEIIIARAVKTISNYSNHIFHTEVGETFSDQQNRTI